MMKGLRLIPDDINIDFMGLRYLAFVLSAVFLIGSVVLVATKGINFGIDFTGGTAIEIRTPVQPDIAALRESLEALDLGAISIQEFGDPKDLLIRMPQQDGDSGAQQAAIDTIKTALDEKFKEQGAVEYRRVEFVGPQVGGELQQQGLLAIVISMLGIMAYIWFRFEWQFGVTGLVALLHDTLGIVGLFALTQMEFSLSTVAAILLVAGYSINDTVIVFDRIREDLRKYKKMPLAELLNMAVNQTLSRTLVTSGTTLLALIALYLFGGEIIAMFVTALIFGIIVGTYSSIFVGAQLLIYMNIRRNQPVEEAAAA
jgi:preprotein translocase subunit SecF